jgi:oligopeptide/dipeptide ABC transporter ATP-binding protein
MLQRTLIAIALAGDPRILVADEPTTALDVIIQDQILSLLLDLQRDMGMTLVMVSHDLSVISQICDRVAVMYAGQIVELAPTDQLLRSPQHPYTAALLRSLPGAVGRDEPLTTIGGAPPQLVDLPASCRFRPRCPYAEEACGTWTTDLLAAADGGRPSDGSRAAAGWLDGVVRCRRHAELQLVAATAPAVTAPDRRDDFIEPMHRQLATGERTGDQGVAR